ncbi:hypothetical protein GE061_013154 [Apolygus lucorum]|uniref:MoaB/Mog domain-containing protein n=1 Tax=Apolygus lucorum TaxID=248454 RepID=A0A8S9XWI5_APOLU|nr:hypothetical protein GE061_013154 [Apolygus lucorum]
MPVVNVAILTVSDRCSCGEAEDKSGPALKQILLREEFVVWKEDCVADEANLIEEKLREWSKQGSHVDVILTTGGTGFAPRDVTPEATLRVVERLCPAITTAMTVASLKATSLAMLSRSVSGIKNSSLIINLPGSVKGATECLETVLPCLQHATDLMRDSKSLVEQTHSSMKQNSVGMLGSKVNDLKVTSRSRISPWPMVSMHEATEIVMNSVTTMEVMSVPLSAALGYVTSKDVAAVENLPPFRASVKDGYAVHSSSGIGVFKVSSALTAGCSVEELPDLREKECVRVNTGGPVPHGADAVVQVEDTFVVEADGDGNEILVNITKQAAPNQDIRPVGCDIARGEYVLPIFTEIRSAEQGILAAAGATFVSVFRKPTVAVLSTGNELVPAGEELRPGTVWDSNMTTLRSLLAENGFQSYDMGIAKDTWARRRLQCVPTYQLI